VPSTISGTEYNIKSTYSLCIALTTALEKGAWVVVALMAYRRSVGANMQLQRRYLPHEISKTRLQVCNAPDPAPSRYHVISLLSLTTFGLLILSDPKIGTTK
jgi:hypothetical protein